MVSMRLRNARARVRVSRVFFWSHQRRTRSVPFRVYLFPLNSISFIKKKKKNHYTVLLEREVYGRIRFCSRYLKGGTKFKLNLN